MDTLHDFWKSFKKRPDYWFFYMFLFSFPFSIRKVVYFIPINESFNEFASISIYISDIFLFLTLLSWFTILYNNYIELSIKNTHLSPSPTNSFKSSTINHLNVSRLPHKMFHVEHFFWGGTFLPRWNIFSKTACFSKYIYSQVINNKIFLYLLIIGFFSLLSTLWSQDKALAIFRSIKIFEFTFFSFYIFKNVPRGTFLNWTLLSIVISGLINAIFGILQFFQQKSLGLFWLKESIISTKMTGVAKIVLNGETYLRSYGLLPHPNIFGGFLIFSIISTVLYFKICDLDKNNLHLKCSTWNISSGPNHFFQKKLLRKLFLSIQLFALILTFSKSAIIGLFIAVLYLNVPRGTFKIADTPKWLKLKVMFRKCTIKCSTWNIFHIMGHFFLELLRDLRQNSQFKKYSLVLLILILLFFIIRPSYDSFIGTSINDRISLFNVSRGTFLENPIFGIGSGQYVLGLIDRKNIQEWQYEPIHNVFLLILAEIGIIPLILFILTLYKLSSSQKIIPSQKKCSTLEEMFHPRRNVPRGTFYGAGVEHSTGQAWNILRGRRGTINYNSETDDLKTKNHIITENYFIALLLAFIFIMLFDHYLWDIQQGQILLWLIFGFLLKK